MAIFNSYVKLPEGRPWILPFLARSPGRIARQRRLRPLLQRFRTDRADRGRRNVRPVGGWEMVIESARIVGLIFQLTICIKTIQEFLGNGDFSSKNVELPNKHIGDFTKKTCGFDKETGLPPTWGRRCADEYGKTTNVQRKNACDLPIVMML